MKTKQTNIVFKENALQRSYGKITYKNLSINEKINFKANDNWMQTYGFFQFVSLQIFLKQTIVRDFLKDKTTRLIKLVPSHLSKEILNERATERKTEKGKNLELFN